MSGILMLVIAFLVLIAAIAMKVIANTGDSRLMFKLTVGGFLLLYILAAIAISYLNPTLPAANINAFTSTVSPAAPTAGDPSLPAAPAQDIIIRQ